MQIYHWSKYSERVYHFVIRCSVVNLRPRDLAQIYWKIEIRYQRIDRSRFVSFPIDATNKLNLMNKLTRSNQLNNGIGERFSIRSFHCIIIIDDGIL